MSGSVTELMNNRGCGALRWAPKETAMNVREVLTCLAKADPEDIVAIDGASQRLGRYDVQRDGIAGATTALDADALLIKLEAELVLRRKASGLS
jgi:hypothetical protein